MRKSVVLGSSGLLKPGKLRWLRAVLWGVLLFGILLTVPSLIQVYGIALSTNTDPMLYGSVPQYALLGWTAVAVFIGIGLYGGLVMLGERRYPDELGLHGSLAELAAGLAIGAAMMAVAVALMWVVGAISITPQAAGNPARALAFTLQSGVPEEITLRLVVFRLLWRAFGIWAALALSAFLFGALHLSNPNASWFAAISIAIEAGVMLAGFYILTGRIWAAIGVHAGWNFTQGWIFGAPVSGTSLFDGGPLHMEPAPGVAEWLSGGAFGPEASFAGLLVGTAAGVITLWLAWQRGRLRAADA